MKMKKTSSDHRDFYVDFVHFGLSPAIHWQSSGHDGDSHGDVVGEENDPQTDS